MSSDELRSKTMPVPRKPVMGAPTGIPRAAPVREPRGPIVFVITIAFVAFACSLPFEAALLLGGEGFFSVSRLVGYLYFLLCLLRPGVTFRKPPLALWFFGVYFAIYVVLAFFQPSAYVPEIFSTGFRLAQFLALMWVSYNLFQIERAARWCLWGFGISCSAVGILLALGIGASEYHGAVGRQSVFNTSPNTIASMIGLGAVAMIGMAYGRAGVGTRAKVVAWGGFLVVAAAITKAGSRGALVGLGAGLMTLVASQGSARTRLRNFLIVTLGLAACIGITLASQTSANRWHRTIDEGAVAGRDRIFRAAFWMFVERPVLGWGPASNYYELGRRLGLPKRDTHNLVLWILTEQGMVGSIPFATGLILCFRSAWRGRKGKLGMMPVALFAAGMAVNLSGTYYVTKWFWFVLAYAAASETYLKRQRRVVRRLDAARPVGAIRNGRPALAAAPGFSPREIGSSLPPRARQPAPED